MKYISLAVAALSVFTAAEAKPVSKQRRQFDGTNVANQLTDGTPCRDVTVIFARGTFEGGNIGAVVGPFFGNQLAKDFGADKIAFQGVEYAANVSGFLAGGDADGSARMARLAEQAAYNCPNTNLVLSGYSQGAQLVHNAAGLISECLAAFVSSVVLFGDPFKGRPLTNIDASRVLTICHEGDDICKGGYQITESHLNYSADVGTASQFVKDHAVLP